jgi:hypothetical protein
MSYLIDTNIISEVRKGARCDLQVSAWRHSKSGSKPGRAQDILPPFLRHSSINDWYLFEGHINLLPFALEQTAASARSLHFA